MLSSQYFVRVHVFRKYTTSINLINFLIYSMVHMNVALLSYYIIYFIIHNINIHYSIIEIIYLAKYIIIIKVFVLDNCVFFFTNKINLHALIIIYNNFQYTVLCYCAIFFKKQVS